MVIISRYILLYNLHFEKFAWNEVSVHKCLIDFSHDLRPPVYACNQWRQMHDILKRGPRNEATEILHHFANYKSGLAVNYEIVRMYLEEIYFSLSPTANANTCLRIGDNSSTSRNALSITYQVKLIVSDILSVWRKMLSHVLAILEAECRNNIEREKYINGIQCGMSV